MCLAALKHLIINLKFNIKKRFRVNEKWGATTAAIDASLKASDFHDTSVIIDMDSMHESYSPSDIQSIYKNRFAAVPISETFTNRSSLIEILKHVNLILMSCMANNYITNQSINEGVSIEDYLHDIGAISIISSTNQVNKIFFFIKFFNIFNSISLVVAN
jgi:urease alpha subunit